MLQKVWLWLEESRVNYRIRKVTMFCYGEKEPWFLAANPGGMLPGPRAFEAAVNGSGLTISDRFFFGPSYAETLRRWDADFLDAWPKIERLGFDERFRRMWHYYLKYCEAGFDTGRIDVAQFVIERE